jgi:hypothetical protein
MRRSEARFEFSSEILISTGGLLHCKIRTGEIGFSVVTWNTYDGDDL